MKPFYTRFAFPILALSACAPLESGRSTSDRTQDQSLAVLRASASPVPVPVPFCFVTGASGPQRACWEGTAVELVVLDAVAELSWKRSAQSISRL